MTSTPDTSEANLAMRQDLHDRVGPVLSALTLRLGTIRFHLGEGTIHDLARASELLEALESELDDMVTDVRNALAHREHRFMPLAECLQRRVASFNAGRAHSWVRLDLDGELGWLPSRAQGVTMMVVSEALTNVVRHANARHAWVAASHDGSRITFSVADDGTYHDPTGQPGLGVESMSARVTAAGGWFVLAPRAEGGTIIRAELPDQPLLRDRG